MASRSKPTARVVITAFAIYAIAVLALGEVATRGFFTLREGVPFTGSARRNLYYHFYPELRALDAKARDPDGTVRVVLLGASQLHDMARAIADTLKDRLGRPVVVHDLAWPANSTRDALWKYRYVKRPFDLVIIYEGFNEVRANNISAADFREDYSHYTFYDDLRLVEHPLCRHSELCFAIGSAYHVARDAVLGRVKIPPLQPRADLTRFGGELKTPASVRKNVNAILKLARKRRQRVVLMTYAYLAAPRFSLRDKPPDVRRVKFPIEIWGQPEHVVAAVDAHNRVLVELARENPEVAFVDLATRVPKEERYFGDVCHFTTLGVESFLGALVEAIVRFTATRE